MSGDLTRRVHAAAEKAGPGATRAEVAEAVCHELAAWLNEEAVLYSAKLTSTRRGIREPNSGDLAHRDVIEQMGDHLSRVGDERMPS
ncbi:hypothetical protein PV405_08665 [Streptomyces sp. ME02-6979-3A]|uniref:hypothetical protein n=1 Tax=Streptomyces sp. ME02-6979-3A TaxID=3028673 RepID=UPI0029A05D65|nr:hypothetical protein [Streptomyces sp. ME02-6979-3A]MDX3324738.1 hypothetical protein [Streptomyces sp. ME02-6979-3A]